MVFQPGPLISFLGKAAKDTAKELAKAQRDLAWHDKLREAAEREAARGHARETIIRNHEYGAKVAAETIKKLTRGR